MRLCIWTNLSHCLLTKSASSLRLKLKCEKGCPTPLLPESSEQQSILSWSGPTHNLDTDKGSLSTLVKLRVVSFISDWEIITLNDQLPAQEPPCLWAACRKQHYYWPNTICITLLSSHSSDLLSMCLTWRLHTILCFQHSPYHWSWSQNSVCKLHNNHDNSRISISYTKLRFSALSHYATQVPLRFSLSQSIRFS